MSVRGDADGPFQTAARGGKPARRPLWIMRQAGRYLPEYRAVRQRMSFLELCRDPEAATEVTLQPLARFDLDAAILFTDLLIPVPAMGLGLRYDPDPIVDEPVRTREDVERLRVPDPERDLAFTLATARAVREQLPADKALIGFVGAPFTMACYLIEGRGSKHWHRTRRMMHEQPELFDALLARIAAALEPVVTALCANGCDAIQVFDSWASVLSGADFARHAAPCTERLLAAARDVDAVAIHYVNGAYQHLEAMASSDAHMLAVDWRHDLRAFRHGCPTTKALQGNLDPLALFAPEQRLRERVRAIEIVVDEVRKS